jgi:hypothetical protein
MPLRSARQQAGNDTDQHEERDFRKREIDIVKHGGQPAAARNHGISA